MDTMISNRIKRNISLCLGVMELAATIRFATDCMTGGGTPLWYPAATALITAILFVQYNRYRKLVKAGALFRK